jgi:hypothetical protein
MPQSPELRHIRQKVAHLTPLQEDNGNTHVIPFWQLPTMATMVHLPRVDHSAILTIFHLLILDHLPELVEDIPAMLPSCRGDWRKPTVDVMSDNVTLRLSAATIMRAEFRESPFGVSSGALCLRLTTMPCAFDSGRQVREQRNRETWRTRKVGLQTGWSFDELAMPWNLPEKNVFY